VSGERPDLEALRAQLAAWRDGGRLRALLRDDTVLGAGVRLALVDTGVDADVLRRRAAERSRPAPALTTLLLTGPAETPTTQGGPPSAPHGTTVADIILALVPAVELVSIDIFGPRGQADVETLAAALRWAATSGRAQIINVSLGVAEANLYPPARRQLLWRAVEEAYHGGVLVVAAAHGDHPLTRGYPALFAPPLVSVTKSPAAPPTGLDYVAGDRVEFAAHGRGYFGPFSSDPASSWAAPHASALAARLLCVEPTLKPFELKTLLYWAARK
jgi:subtilisin